MKNAWKILAFALCFANGPSVWAQCQSDNAHGSAAKVSYRHQPDVIDIAVNSDIHTTLVAAVKAAGLVETLKGEGPFTIFAPTNAAFAALPDGTVESLLEPANRSMLTGILTYHVVAGKIDSNAVLAAIHKGNGSATLTTLQGGKLRAGLSDGNVVLTDEQGNRSIVTAVDLGASNGVIHVIDRVVLPK